MQYNFCYKAIYNGLIEKNYFDCLDREDQTFHWINISDIDSIKMFPINVKKYIVDVSKSVSHNIERGIGTH